jgi:hypothetical protein
MEWFSLFLTAPLDDGVVHPGQLAQDFQLPDVVGLVPLLNSICSPTVRRFSSSATASNRSAATLPSAASSVSSGRAAAPPPVLPE